MPSTRWSLNGNNSDTFHPGKQPTTGYATPGSTRRAKNHKVRLEITSPALLQHSSGGKALRSFVLALDLPSAPWH